jgi:hypothetical protein
LLVANPPSLIASEIQTMQASKYVSDL